MMNGLHTVIFGVAFAVGGAFDGSTFTASKLSSSGPEVHNDHYDN